MFHEHKRNGINRNQRDNQSEYGKHSQLVLNIFLALVVLFSSISSTYIENQTIDSFFKSYPILIIIAFLVLIAILTIMLIRHHNDDSKKQLLTYIVILFLGLAIISANTIKMYIEERNTSNIESRIVSIYLDDYLESDIDTKHCVQGFLLNSNQVLISENVMFSGKDVSLLLGNRKVNLVPAYINPSANLCIAYFDYTIELPDIGIEELSLNEDALIYNNTGTDSQYKLSIQQLTARVTGYNINADYSTISIPNISSVDMTNNVIPMSKDGKLIGFLVKYNNEYQIIKASYIYNHFISVAGIDENTTRYIFSDSDPEFTPASIEIAVTFIGADSDSVLDSLFIDIPQKSSGKRTVTIYSKEKIDLLYNLSNCEVKSSFISANSPFDKSTRTMSFYFSYQWTIDPNSVSNYPFYIVKNEYWNDYENTHNSEYIPSLDLLNLRLYSPIKLKEITGEYYNRSFIGISDTCVNTDQNVICTAKTYEYQESSH